MNERDFDKGYKSGFQFGKEVMLDKVKQAREEIEKIKEPNMSDRTNNMVGREKVLAIIDNLIAESERINEESR